MPSVPEAFPPALTPTVTAFYGLQSWLTYALIGSCFSSLLIPVLIALFFFSTSDIRGRPIFILNVMALLLGIGEGVVLVVLQIQNILWPVANSTSPGGVLTWILFSFWSPALIDSILYLRLWAVYPPTLTSRVIRCIILGTPIVSKMARFVVLSVATAGWAHRARSIGTFLAGLELWPYARVVWCFQLFDNVYMSALFIYQLRHQMHSDSPPIFQHRNPFTSRLRMLFIISISNFVVPCLFSTAQIVIASTDIEATNLTLFLTSTYISIVNNFVTIIGVVFATIWSIGSTWMGSNSNVATTMSGALPSWAVNGSQSTMIHNLPPPPEPTRSGHHSPSSSFQIGWRSTLDLSQGGALDSPITDAKIKRFGFVWSSGTLRFPPA
ncbi:hypothetical protein EYR40_001968 [Pleurotus pulmonarius]|nr:hypothetical protein EYR40_001968 [Pleurotus pulmonarius]KAF4607459.1 hypothetical protein EYR38_001531 [Pleurotus pulmonarius]